MKFNFQLIKRNDGACRAESWLLHTDGFCWISVGKERLFETINSEEPPSNLIAADSERFCGARTYVGELLLALIRVSPYALEPVPQALHKYLSAEGLPSFFRSWTAWLKDADSRYELDDPIWKEHDLATTWLSYRVLDCDFFPGRPRVWLWSDNQKTYWGWDFSQSNTSTAPLYTATQGIMSELTDMYKQSLSDFAISLFGEIECSSTNSVNDARKEVLDYLYLNIRKQPNTDWLRVQAALEKAGIDRI